MGRHGARGKKGGGRGERGNSSGCNESQDREEHYANQFTKSSHAGGDAGSSR